MQTILKMFCFFQCYFVLLAVYIMFNLMFLFNYCRMFSSMQLSDFPSAANKAWPMHLAHNSNVDSIVEI